MAQNELTTQQIVKQDMIDNAIYHFIQSLNPSDKEIPWDIEMIGDVRDVLREWFAVNKRTRFLSIYRIIGICVNVEIINVFSKLKS